MTKATNDAEQTEAAGRRANLNPAATTATAANLTAGATPATTAKPAAAVPGANLNPAAGANPAPKAKLSKKRISKATQRKARLFRHRALRYAVQALFFLLAPGLFSAAFSGIKYIAGQVGALSPVELTSFVLLLIVVVGATVVMGRFFCGYACAFGFLGDVVYDATAALRHKIGLGDLNFPEPLVKVLQLLKFAVLAAICALCFLASYSEVSSYSPWTAFAGIVAGSTEGIRTGAFALLAAIVVLMALRKRAFCQFLCPMGAIFSLLPMLPFAIRDRNELRCPKSCGQCRKNCPVDIWPDKGSLQSGECIACGDCAVNCPLGNISVLRLGVDTKTLKPKFQISGSFWASILIKAALLLVGCWLVGALRFVPSPQDVLPFALPWMLN